MRSWLLPRGLGLCTIWAGLPSVGQEPERPALERSRRCGGLLVAVDPERREDFLKVARRRGLELQAFGRLLEHEQLRVTHRIAFGHLLLAYYRMPPEIESCFKR